MVLHLTVDIDLSDNTYTLTVTDMDHDEIYFPIYNWDCGKNYELEEVTENVINTLDSLCTQKILWNTEKKRKKKHVQHNK